MRAYILTAIVAVFVFFLSESSAEAQTAQIARYTQALLAENGMTEAEARTIQPGEQITIRGEATVVQPGDTIWGYAEDLVFDEAVQRVVEPFETEIASREIRIAELEETIDGRDLTIAQLEGQVQAQEQTINTLSVRETPETMAFLPWWLIAFAAVTGAMSLVFLTLFITEQRRRKDAERNYSEEARKRHHVTTKLAQAETSLRWTEDRLAMAEAARDEHLEAKAGLQGELKAAKDALDLAEEKLIAETSRANTAERTISHAVADKEAAEQALAHARGAYRHMESAFDKQLIMVPITLQFAAHIVPDATRPEHRCFNLHIARDTGGLRVFLPNGANFYYKESSIRSGILGPECLAKINAIWRVNARLPKVADRRTGWRKAAFEQLPTLEEAEAHYDAMTSDPKVLPLSKTG